MKNILIFLLLTFSQFYVSGQDCLFTLNYTQSNCLGAEPSQVIITLEAESGSMKDQMVVNYVGGVAQTPTSLNGIIEWDGMLVGGGFATGNLTGVTENCILTTQITDICDGGATSVGAVQAVPINYKAPVVVNCDEALACFLADIDSYIKIDTLKTVDGLDSILFDLGGTIYNWVDTDTYAEQGLATEDGVDPFGNSYILGQSGIFLADGTFVCIPEKHNYEVLETSTGLDSVVILGPDGLSVDQWVDTQVDVQFTAEGQSFTVDVDGDTLWGAQVIEYNPCIDTSYFVEWLVVNGCDTLGRVYENQNTQCSTWRDTISHDYTPWRDETNLCKENGTTNAEGIITGQNVSIVPNSTYNQNAKPADNTGLYIQAEPQHNLTDNTDRDGEGTILDIDNQLGPTEGGHIMDVDNEGWVEIYQDTGGIMLPYEYNNFLGINFPLAEVWDGKADCLDFNAHSPALIQGSRIEKQLWAQSSRGDRMTISIGDLSSIYDGGGFGVDYNLRLTIDLQSSAGSGTLLVIDYIHQDNAQYKTIRIADSYGSISTPVQIASISDIINPNTAPVIEIDFADDMTYFTTISTHISIDFLNHQTEYLGYERVSELMYQCWSNVDHGKTNRGVFEQVSNYIPEYLNHAIANSTHLVGSRVKYRIQGDPTLYVRW